MGFQLLSGQGKEWLWFWDDFNGIDDRVIHHRHEVQLNFPTHACPDILESLHNRLQIPLRQNVKVLYEEHSVAGTTLKIRLSAPLIPPFCVPNHGSRK
jgi:hypothetical protein